MKVLFDTDGRPIEADSISSSIRKFGNGYNQTVSEIIVNSDLGLDKAVFYKNIATLIPNFKMTRRGPLEGIGFHGGAVQDPKGVIDSCWKEIGKRAVEIRDRLACKKGSRFRILLDVPSSFRKELAASLWLLFKSIVPFCMGEHTYGLVGASKILFAVLPEVSLPIDNTQWRKVFRTIDYGDVILLMAEEIFDWEKISGRRLNDCSPYPEFTLPAIYNVMAMKARP